MIDRSHPTVLRKTVFAGVLVLATGFCFAQSPEPSISDCERLKSTLEAKNYSEAYRLAVVLDGRNCEPSDWAVLSGKALIQTGRYDEGLESIRGVEGQSADSLRAFVDRIQKSSAGSPGHKVALSHLSDTAVNELISPGLNGQPVILRGKERTLSEFPIQRKYDNIYRARKAGDQTPKDPLLHAYLEMPYKGMHQLGTGCVLGDSTVLVTGEAGGHLARSSSSGLTIFRFDPRNNQGPRIFDLADGQHAYAHPAISPDGKWLVISSDRPGGYGGMDLWVSELTPDGPGEWTNAGPAVNSSGNEIFPAFKGDTLIFAADNQEISIGGYDLFMSAPPYETIIHPGQPLNTVYDELCPVVVDGNLTYFVSNRRSSAGRDDIFEVRPVEVREVFDLIYGHIDADLDRGTEVRLVNDAGVMLDRAYIGEDGNFSFTNVKGGETYTLVLPNDSLAAGDELSIFDEDKNLVKQVRSEGGQSFLLELLTPMDYLLDKKINRDESVLTIDILGLLEGGEEEVGGMQIIMQDSDGNVVGRTFTGEEGDFRFDNISPDSRYSFRTEVTDPQAMILIYNDRGELMQRIEPTRGGEFIYVRLRDDEKTITITNEERKRITISEEDLFNLPAIYYGLDDATLSGKSSKTLDKLVEILRENQHISIELSGHTDSRGAVDYNISLSQRRIESVVDYLVGSGILRSRISGRGYGESKLLNHCADGVECSETEHAVNRRTEIRIVNHTN